MHGLLSLDLTPTYMADTTHNNETATTGKLAVPIVAVRRAREATSEVSVFWGERESLRHGKKI
jgi:hypothetical protein